MQTFNTKFHKYTPSACTYFFFYLHRGTDRHNEASDSHCLAQPVSSNLSLRSVCVTIVTSVTALTIRHCYNPPHGYSISTVATVLFAPCLTLFQSPEYNKRFFNHRLVYLTSTVLGYNTTFFPPHLPRGQTVETRQKYTYSRNNRSHNGHPGNGSKSLGVSHEETEYTQSSSALNTTITANRTWNRIPKALCPFFSLQQYRAIKTGRLLSTNLSSFHHPDLTQNSALKRTIVRWWRSLTTIPHLRTAKTRLLPTSSSLSHHLPSTQNSALMYETALSTNLLTSTGALYVACIHQIYNVLVNILLQRCLLSKIFSFP